MPNAQGLLLMAGVGGVLVVWSIATGVMAMRSTDPNTYHRELQEAFGLFMTGMSLCMLAGMIKFVASPVQAGWFVFVGAFAAAALMGLYLTGNAHRTYRRLMPTPISPPPPN